MTSIRKEPVTVRCTGTHIRGKSVKSKERDFLSHMLYSVSLYVFLVLLMPICNWARNKKIQIIALLETAPAVFGIYPSWAAAVVCCMYYWVLHLPMLKTVNIFHCIFAICYHTARGTVFPALLCLLLRLALLPLPCRTGRSQVSLPG